MGIQLIESNMSSLYIAVDLVISEWARNNSLTVFHAYRDDEVRSVNVVDSHGNRFHIWIDPPHNEEIAVHAWNYQQTRCDWKVPIGLLNNKLEQALQIVKSWM